MIISFREGCSGNWFVTLLTMGSNTIQAEFRQDGTGKTIPKDVFHFDGNTDEQTLNSLERYQNQPLITCHSTNYSLLREIWPGRTILRITPRTRIYQSIAAAFYKLGPGSNATVDWALEYIKHYYEMHTRSDPLPSIENSYIIDFGDLCQLASLKIICKSMFGVELKDNHLKFFNEYWALQKIVVNENQLDIGISKEKLLSLFSKENDVFNLACFIYIYEKLNGITESQRTWSIDNVPTTLRELSETMTYSNFDIL